MENIESLCIAIEIPAYWSYIPDGNLPVSSRSWDGESIRFLVSNQKDK